MEDSAARQQYLTRCRAAQGTGPYYHVAQAILALAAAVLDVADAIREGKE